MFPRRGKKNEIHKEMKSYNTINDAINDLKNPVAFKFFIKKYRKIIQSERGFVDKYLDLVSPDRKYEN